MFTFLLHHYPLNVQNNQTINQAVAATYNLVEMSMKNAQGIHKNI
jgi:hypothetical protein